MVRGIMGVGGGQVKFVPTMAAGKDALWIAAAAAAAGGASRAIDATGGILGFKLDPIAGIAPKALAHYGIYLVSQWARAPAVFQNAMLAQILLDIGGPAFTAIETSIGDILGKGIGEQGSSHNPGSSHGSHLSPFGVQEPRRLVQVLA